jgi:hypothetical protein
MPVLVIDIHCYFKEVHLLNLLACLWNILLCGVFLFVLLNHLVNVLLKSSGHIFQLLLHAAVPVVLYGVVSAAFQHLCNLSPSILDLAVHEEEDPLFFLGPLLFFDLGVQMVVPSFSALLALSLREVLADHCPLLGTNLLYELH